MKVGDLVRRKEGFHVLRPFIDFGGHDFGIVIDFPEDMGDVVDLMVGDKKLRYWISDLEVLPEFLEHEMEVMALSLAD